MMWYFGIFGIICLGYIILGIGISYFMFKAEPRAGWDDILLFSLMAPIIWVVNWLEK